MFDISNSVRIAQDYMSFLVSAKSTAGHGIHSPFVYGFVNEVLNSKDKWQETINEIEWFRNWQVNSGVSLGCSFYGAGSRVHTKPTSLCRIIKDSSVSPKIGGLLFRLAKWVNAQNILELGTSVGMSTLYLASACPNGLVTTLEGDSQRLEIAKSSFDYLGYSNISVVEGDFDTRIGGVLDASPKFDLVFFDGNHKAEPTLRYFRQCLEKKHNDSVFVFDDIRWSNEMFRAWQVISHHKSVSISIDLFNVGVVIFRKGIAKQNFMINF
ncbi:MAG: O-methyltransferase [Bacteroidales bacterium]